MASLSNQDCDQLESNVARLIKVHGWQVGANDKTCSRCGGTLAGEILNAADRLAAEEALEFDE